MRLGGSDFIERNFQGEHSAGDAFATAAHCLMTGKAEMGDLTTTKHDSRRLKPPTTGFGTQKAGKNRHIWTASVHISDMSSRLIPSNPLPASLHSQPKPAPAHRRPMPRSHGRRLSAGHSAWTGAGSFPRPENGGGGAPGAPPVSLPRRKCRRAAAGHATSANSAPHLRQGSEAKGHRSAGSRAQPDRPWLEATSGYCIRGTPRVGPQSRVH